MRKKVLALRTSDSPLETDSSFQHMGFSLHTTLSTLDPDAIVENLASLLHQAQASQTPEEKEPLLTKVIKLANQTLHRHDLEPTNPIHSQLIETYVQAFEMMGDLLFEKAQSAPDAVKKRERITYASALFNHALMMAQKHPSQNATNQSQLIHQLTKNTMAVEELFLSSVLLLQDSHTTSVPQHVIHHTDIEHKETLERLRITCEEEMARIDTMPRTTWEEKAAQSDRIQILYQRISGTMKQLIAEMIQECETALGTPPCQYAVIGLGSLARGEMTPYSDLEWAILIDDQDRTTEPRPYTETEISANKEYFRNLTTLLHLKVLNLGETIIPAMNIPGLTGKEFYDSETPRGFAFDGQMATARKTPLGKPGEYELIQTFQKMADYQSARELRDNNNQPCLSLNQYHLQTVLSHVTHILGSSAFTESYQRFVKEKLDQRVEIPLHQNQFKLQLSEIRYERTVLLLEQDLKTFDPRINSINEQGKSYDVKKEIYRLPSTILDALATYYSLESESSWDRIDELHQKGHLTNPMAIQALKSLVGHTTAMRLRAYLKNEKQQEFMGILPPDPTNEQIKNAFQLNDVSLLFEIYYTVLPFFNAAADFIERAKVFQTVFSDDSLYSSDDNLINGLVNMRLLRYSEAERYLDVAANNNPTEGTFVSLGITRQILGKFPESKNAFENVLNACREDWKKAIIINNLGAVALGMGHYKKAEEYFKQALAINEVLPNAQKAPVLAATHSNLAEALRHQDKLDEAKSHAFRALEINESYYQGKDHISISSSLNIMGLIHLDLGQIHKARKYVQKALNIAIQTYGPINPVVANTYANLAKIVLQDNQFDEAKDFLERSKQIYLEIYKTEIHHHVADLFNTLANVAFKKSEYFERNDLYETATTFFEKSIQIYKSLRMERHISIAACYGSFGAMLLKQKQYRLAIQWLLLTLSIQKENNLPSAKTYNALGESYRSIDCYQNAKNNFEVALTILSLERNTHDLANTYRGLGKVAALQSQFDEAKRCFLKAKLIYDEVYGDTPHVDIAVTCNEIGDVLQQEGKFEKAILYCEKAIEILVNYFKTEWRLDIGTAYANLGTLKKSLGQYSDALKNFENALRILGSILPGNHPRIRQIAKDKNKCICSILGGK